jgi:hypothetical protein
VTVLKFPEGQRLGPESWKRGDRPLVSTTVPWFPPSPGFLGFEGWYVCTCARLAASSELRQRRDAEESARRGRRGTCSGWFSPYRGLLQAGLEATNKSAGRIAAQAPGG